MNNFRYFNSLSILLSIFATNVTVLHLACSKNISLELYFSVALGL